MQSYMLKSRNFAEFENICDNKKYRKISSHVDFVSYTD